MGRAARIEEWGAAGARQRGSDDAKVSRTRSSSTAGRVGPRRPSEPAAVAAGNWNELVALSPQVLLDRLTKGVEKGRSWLGTQMEGPPLAERPKKSKEWHRVLLLAFTSGWAQEAFFLISPLALTTRGAVSPYALQGPERYGPCTA
ncbi:unnamed protein product [Cladocopium goreaui]|uniref:RRM domain-containing protein n=1 Tax=Cladocopium goreaui TaxID=2562237 RepID=A0A9P1FZ37_9DINO|nr:unnamed protein product [Cladocopium goreaui]